MQMRHDITGLRAIAVLGVIVSHAIPDVLPGGWLGVDVFFVISGFLITTILLHAMQDATFTLRSFWAKRIRRLVPALVFMLFTTGLLFSILLYSQAHLIAAKTGFWSLLGIGNLYLSTQTNYFSLANDHNPYVHLWSLGVEEQFYLFFPFLLLLLRNKQTALWGSVAIFTAVSFFHAFTSQTEPAAYFLPWNRAWELLLGVGCAGLAYHKRVVLHSPLWTYSGILLIFIAYLYGAPTAGWVFPSLVACFGTSIILLRNHQQPIPILESRPFLLIGLASYSLYLWHQPVLVLAKLFDPVFYATPLVLTIVIAAIFLTGFLSRIYIESPFLEKRTLVNPTRFGIAITASLLFFFALTTVPAETYRNKVVGTILATETPKNRLDVNYGLGIQCDSAAQPVLACQWGENPTTLLWGDSHAMHLVQMLQELHLPFIQMIRSGCGPNSSTGMLPSPSEICQEFNNQVERWLFANDHITTIVLSSRRWGLHLNEDKTAEQYAQTLQSYFAPFFQKGGTVLLVGDNPLAPFDVGSCIQSRLWIGLSLEGCHWDKKLAHAEEEVLDALRIPVLTQAAAHPNINVLFLRDVVCPDGHCQTTINDTFIYRDQHHLSYEGSAYLATLPTIQTFFKMDAHDER